jgi:hypothetical protein
VERPGLAVVRGEHGGVAAVRQRVVHPGDLADVGRPADRVLGEQINVGDRGGPHGADRDQRQPQHERHRAVDREQRGPDPAQVTLHRDHPRRERHRQDEDRVVRLRAGDEGEQHDHDEHHDEEPHPRVSPESAEAGDPQHDQRWPEQHQQQHPHAHPDVTGVVLGQGPPHPQLRQVVGELVDHVGQPDHQRQRRAAPDVRRPQSPAGADQDQPEGDPGEEHEDQQLVVRREPGDRACGEPPARLVAQLGPQHQQRDRCPRRQVDGGGEEDVPEQQQGRGGGHPPGGPGLGLGAAPQLAGDQGGQDEAGDGGQGRRDPQQPGPAGVERGQAVCDQRRERRLVDVPPGGPEHGEVELVAVVAVAVREDAQDHAQQHGGWRDASPGDRWRQVAGHRSRLGAGTDAPPLAAPVRRRSTDRLCI